MRHSIDEVSAIAGRAREEARRVGEKVDAVIAENEDLKTINEDQRIRISKREHENDVRRSEIRKLESKVDSLIAVIERFDDKTGKINQERGHQNGKRAAGRHAHQALW